MNVRTRTSTSTHCAALATMAAATAAWAGPVTLTFESLDQTGIYGGAGWDTQNTTRVAEFAAAGIDFGGTASGWNHDVILPGTSADGAVSLVNAYRTAGIDTYTTIEMTAVGSTWEAFEILALTTSNDVTMSAFDSGGTLLESIDLGRTLDAGAGGAWQTFMFSVSGISRVTVTGTGADVLIDTIHYDPLDSVVIPLPGSGMLALAGLAAIGVGTRRRS